MARLRNRMVKAEFYTDPDLLVWPRDKRHFYQGLWALAEDSGCLEDSPFGWKLVLFPSPLDADVTMAELQVWRDELVTAGKLVPYADGGKRYLFLRTFHEHERPRNPQRPDLPLPAWVKHEVTAPKRGDGTVTRHAYSVITDALPSQNGDSTVALMSPQSSLVPSSLVPSNRAPAREDPVENSAPSPKPSKDRKRNDPVPLCGEGECAVRSLRCGIRSDLAAIVGVAHAGELYNSKTDLGSTMSKLAAQVCQRSHNAFPHLNRQERESACTAILRAYVVRARSAHEGAPIANWCAYVAGTLKRMASDGGGLGDVCGEDCLKALGDQFRDKPPDGHKSDLTRLGERVNP